MVLEQYEIIIREHYRISRNLLEQVRRGVELAATEEGRREAAARYRRIRTLHEKVEERYKKVWEESEEGSEAILLFKSDV